MGNKKHASPTDIEEKELSCEGKKATFTEIEQLQAKQCKSIKMKSNHGEYRIETTVHMQPIIVECNMLET